MTAPTPARKASELIESINEMVDGGVNENRLAEIVAAAKKMKEIGQYTDSCVVLGMIAAIQGNHSEVDRLFNAAIHHHGRDTWVLTNYAAALSNLNRRAEAIRFIDEAVSLSPTDIYLLRTAVEFHRDAFDIEGARNLIDRYEALGMKFPDKQIERDMALLAELMAEHNISWTDMSSRVELASSVLRQMGLPALRRRELFDDGIMVLEFQINSDVESISRAENALNDAIAEIPYSPIDDCLYLTCATASV